MPGPVSWNWTHPLQPVKSFAAMSSTPTPPGLTSLNMTGVLTSIWYVPGGIDETCLPKSSTIVNVQFIAYTT